MPKISVIIPTYNESSHLPLLLSDLSVLNEKVEVIVVDSDSKDNTGDIATIYGAKLFKSGEKNRGLQLTIGATKANGEWFFFLHADSRLKQGWFEELESIIEKNKSLIYYFKFKINNTKFTFRFLELLVNLRCYFLNNPYGDQGLIIHRDNYFKNNGYKKIPLMEDLDFIRRLDNKKNLKMFKFPIYTNSRKWEKTNFILQAFKNWQFRKRWLKGESIKSIYDDYYKT